MDTSKKLITSFIGVVTSTILFVFVLVAGVFAWYTTNKSSDVSGISLKVIGDYATVEQLSITYSDNSTYELKTDVYSKDDLQNRVDIGLDSILDGDEFVFTIKLKKTSEAPDSIYVSSMFSGISIYEAIYDEDGDIVGSQEWTGWPSDKDYEIDLKDLFHIYKTSDSIIDDVYDYDHDNSTRLSNSTFCTSGLIWDTTINETIEYSFMVKFYNDTLQDGDDTNDVHTIEFKDQTLVVDELLINVA